MDESIIYRKIYNTILQSDRFALVMHRRPDGDTIGSAVAFGLFLKKLGKEFRFFCADQPAENYYAFLNSAGVLGFRVKNIEDVLEHKADIIILFDCADWKQAGLIDGHLETVNGIINIDHHVTNNGDCDLNLIVPGASSTCEIIYQFFKKNNIPITKHTATALFMGLVTDTGNFTNAATTNFSLFVASELLLKGAKLKDTHTSFTRNQNLGLLKLWGLVLKRLKYSEENKVVSTFIKLDDFKECGTSENSAEGISNFLGGSLNADVIIVYVELPDGFVKASIRSNDNFDASEYAKKFGGGGHKKAAGFSTEGIIKEEKDKWTIEINV